MVIEFQHLEKKRMDQINIYKVISESVDFTKNIINVAKKNLDKDLVTVSQYNIALESFNGILNKNNISILGRVNSESSSDSKVKLNNLVLDMESFITSSESSLADLAIKIKNTISETITKVIEISDQVFNFSVKTVEGYLRELKESSHINWRINGGLVFGDYLTDGKGIQSRDSLNSIEKKISSTVDGINKIGETLYREYINNAETICKGEDSDVKKFIIDFTSKLEEFYPVYVSRDNKKYTVSKFGQNDLEVLNPDVYVSHSDRSLKINSNDIRETNFENMKVIQADMGRFLEFVMNEVSRQSHVKQALNNFQKQILDFIKKKDKGDEFPEQLFGAYLLNTIRDLSILSTSFIKLVVHGVKPIKV